MMASTLGYYNLYSYNADIGYFIGACVSGFGVILEFFICVFFRDHFYSCIADGCGKPPPEKILCFKAVEDFLTAFGVIFVLSWSGFLIAPVALQSNLYYYDYNDPTIRPLSSCQPLF